MDENDHNKNNKNDKKPIINLPSSTVNNLSQEIKLNNKHKMMDNNPNINNNNTTTTTTTTATATATTTATLDVDVTKFKHIASSSDTHTINSEFSETVYTEGTEYTDGVDSQYGGYTNLKPRNSYKGRGGGSLMSVGSASSITVSTYDSSQKKAPNVLPPALETVNEPSSTNINTMKYADEEMLHGGGHGGGGSSRTSRNSHTSHQSVVNHMTPPHINMNDDDMDDLDDFSSIDKRRHHHKSRGSVDLQQDLQMEYDNNNSSILNCLLCGCCCSSKTSSSNISQVELVSNESNHDIYTKKYNHKLDKIQDEDIKYKLNNNKDKENQQKDSEIIQLDMDDWRTFTGSTRIRRPTQYTTVTNNEDSTVNVDDVRMWEDPFGKGASGRVFKGLYLPLCQIMALKVTSRLDNDNVKQILGEFKQQQEVLPDCDELMRIHGWYKFSNK